MLKLTSIDRIFCAIDTPSLDDAMMLADLLSGEVGAIKLGKEFFTANGPEGVRRIAGEAEGSEATDNGGRALPAKDVRDK